jgi:serine protease Do
MSPRHECLSAVLLYFSQAVWPASGAKPEPDCMSEFPETPLDPKAEQAQPAELGTPGPTELSDSMIDETASETQPSIASNAATDDTIANSRGLSYQTLHLATSTLLSLLMVMALLLMVRLLVPSLVESIRYGWHRGQLRAEYELSGERLKSVSLDSLADVSQLVSQRVGPSVVHINLLRSEKEITSQTSEIPIFDGLLDRNDPHVRYKGQGSGFVIDTAGHILTNNHVIAGSGKIEVTLSDGRQLPATVIGTDPATDLAVLKVEASRLMPIDWGNSDAVSVGTPVWALGSPFGLQQTVTFGIISGKHRIDLRGTRYERSLPGDNAYGDLMQSDVALNPGNSGGPLANSMGEVIGVNAAILGETYKGISFSIPSQVAMRVAGHLIVQGDVPRGWLGVQMIDMPMDDRFDEQGNAIPGVLVTGLPDIAGSTSPARAAGIELGDLIVEFNGHRVLSQVDLRKLIGESEVGESLKIAVTRKAEKFEFEVVLGRRPQGLNNR